MYIGIVGNEAAKFTKRSEEAARELIRLLLLNDSNPILVSGGCHLGGIDIYAEQEADKLGIQKEIFLPKELNWLYGYKPRNIKIAQKSDVVHNLVVNVLPSKYSGMRFKSCYHCKTTDHVKSGGCWTAKYAEAIGKQARWHIIKNDISPV